jgi:hypothetical protein
MAPYGLDAFWREKAALERKLPGTKIHWNREERVMLEYPSLSPLPKMRSLEMNLLNFVSSDENRAQHGVLQQAYEEFQIGGCTILRNFFPSDLVSFISDFYIDNLFQRQVMVDEENQMFRRSVVNEYCMSLLHQQLARLVNYVVGAPPNSVHPLQSKLSRMWKPTYLTDANAHGTWCMLVQLRAYPTNLSSLPWPFRLSHKKHPQMQTTWNPDEGDAIIFNEFMYSYWRPMLHASQSHVDILQFEFVPEEIMAELKGEKVNEGGAEATSSDGA